MKALVLSFAVALSGLPLGATTISVVPIHEPISMHGTDVDDVVTDTGEVLQATIVSRPMALTGAFPEVLVESIRTPHKFPTNNPNYNVDEVNLLVLCDIGISAEMTEEGLKVSLNVAKLNIPEEVDLTARQVLRLALGAIRKTLEAYQQPQTDPLKVMVSIDGVDDGTASLRDLSVTFTLGGG